MKRSAYNPLAWIGDELSALESQGLRRELTTHGGPQGAVIKLDDRELINFGSNDYLGLAADKRLSVAATSEAQEQAWGAGASPLVTGHTAAHARLEQMLAQFEGAEAALVFSSGYAANLGTIAALASPGDVVYSDQKNHASIIDGCRLSRSDVRVYPHRNVEALEQLLRGLGGARRRLIVTESVFSMDGDRAPLVQLAALAERYECMLIVDEAHATGVFGPLGRGLAEELGVAERVSARVGTLSKALGCAGGFVCGSAALIEWLINRARPYIFSTAGPPANCAAALAALEIVRVEPWRRTTLLERAETLRAQLQRQGWRVESSQSQIIPIYLGKPSLALWLSARLRSLGMLVPAIRPPSVPQGESLLRISLSVGHSDAMIEQLVIALGRLRVELAGSVSGEAVDAVFSPPPNDC